MDTIYALATPRGKSGVAIVRVSGEKAFYAAEKLTGKRPRAGGMSLRLVRDRAGAVLDEALLLGFSGPKSFTGEDVIEIQLHGSVAIIDAVLRELDALPGFRMANAGEFSRRALENNRLDLAQIEGLADLIESETEAQRQQAMRVFSGALGEKAGEWRATAIRAAALLEATIDFVDEEVPEDVSDEVLGLIDRLLGALEKESEGVASAERIREGFEVAIVGPPNVGKSTLLNALAGRDAAITSEVAGTTRDVIEVRMDIRGLPVTLLDTAGMRDSEDAVEKIGVEKGRERSAQADLRVFLHDGEGLRELEPGAEDIVIRGKGDLTDDIGAVSGVTGKGVSSLVDRIATVLEARVSASQTAIRGRHKVAIDRARDSLISAKTVVEVGRTSEEIAAEELRTAIRALDSLIGRVDVEDLLDEIFSSFCLGK
ncbi:MAG TPA: tRNA uridine-5-carboxymethylaminomethyl(34) synthesis GTPase MnmE [Aliiroseovarius sp.]|nr:tRNA uridine-5-carboxymethylaminomethyl(34) synthesis GTPase MnmE [Aliiroseovarius sp.]